MKKITFLFLLALLPLMASAAIEVDGVYYYIYNEYKKEAAVGRGDTKYAGDINILPTITYEGVTYTVKEIVDHAFEGCRDVTSVTIPNSVTTIGEWAFYCCTGLTSITIPSSVTDIGWYAFSCCSSLTSITVESGNPNYDSRNNCNALIETATNTLIVGCKNTVIPNNVTEIRNTAFQECSDLKTILIPNSVTTIGKFAFYGCLGLTHVDIPNSVTSIGESAFNLCTNLTSVTIPYGVTTIENGAFYNCSSLTSVTIPSSVKVIGGAAFSRCLGLTTAVISDGVASIGESVFNDCSKLTSLTIPNTVKSIGRCAFQFCSGLTSITIPNGVTSIEENTFYGCTGLTSVTIPNTVKSIGTSAFVNCSSLTSLSIPDSVKSIDYQAFDYCSKLMDVYCYAKNVPSTAIDAFLNINLNNATLHVSGYSVDAYKNTAPWSGFGKILAIGDEPVTTGITINETNFPDENFRNWILSQEYGQDGVLTDAEIAEVTFIAIYEKNVQSLQGIEFFTALESLQCMRNQLTSLDVSKNTLLRVLGCDENQLTSLDLSKNTLLMILDCSYNKLTSLDISTLTALESLQCHDNQLTSLDVSNTALVYIECYRNQLKGTAMEAFVKGLPQITSGKEWDGLMYIVASEDEGNVMTNTQVAVAKAKGWNPHYYDGEGWVPYADIKPVLRGDVNEDGQVNGTDIQEVINIIVNAE